MRLDVARQCLRSLVKCLLLFVTIRGAPAPAQNSPGAVDPSFFSEAGTDGDVDAITIQPDGKLLIAGRFQHINSVARAGVGRLNDDGTLDQSFDPGSGLQGLALDQAITLLASGPDSKIVVGGVFTNYNGFLRLGTVRINNDGTIDSTFNPQSSFPLQPTVADPGVLLQPDGRIITRSAKRLNLDGTIDPNFELLVASSSGIWTSSLLSGAVTSEGDLLLLFVFYVRSSILNPTGGPFYSVMQAPLEPGRFTLGGATSPLHPTVQIAESAVDRWLVAGAGMAVMTPDGKLDSNFNGIALADALVRTFVRQRDGKILVGSGGFYYAWSTNRLPALLRLNSDGALDETLSADTAVPGTSNPVVVPPVTAIAVQPDGAIVVGGSFTHINGATRFHLARLLGDSAPRLTAPILTDIVITQAAARFSFLTVPGYRYVPEFKDALDQTNWQSLPVVVGNGASQTVSDENDLGAQRFYRLRLE